MLVYYLFYKFTSFSLKFGTPGDEGFIYKDAISLLWWIVATWFKEFLNCHTLCSYLYRAGEFTNNVSCFLGRVVFAYPLWPGDVFTEFCCACWWHLAQGCQCVDMPVILRQFLLEHCSVSSIRESWSPSSVRRDVTSE